MKGDREEGKRHLRMLAFQRDALTAGRAKKHEKHTFIWKHQVLTMILEGCRFDAILIQGRVNSCIISTYHNIRNASQIAWVFGDELSLNLKRIGATIIGVIVAMLLVLLIVFWV
ncbi:MAG: hypothetical protein ACFFFC_07505 [Candidatus Thorarchaeota archaeon]